MTAILGSAAFVVGLVVGWPAPYAMACVAMVAVMLRRERWLVLAVVVACAAAGDQRGSALMSRPVFDGSVGGPQAGTVAGYARRYGESQRFVMTVNGTDVCTTAEGRLSLGRGDVMEFDGVVRPRSAESPDRLPALLQLGCGGSVFAANVRVVERGDGPRRWIDDQRRNLVDWFSATVPGNEGVLLAGLVVGDDSDLSFDAKEDFLALGMSHITAVSGSNLALLTFLLLRPGAKRRAWAIEGFLLSGLWFYVLLAGAGPSTIRAGLTATLAVVAMRSGRKPELLSIACLVAAGQVGVEPHLIDNLAYRLSTIAMLVMISTLAGRPGERIVDKYVSLVLCTTAIQLATLTFVPQRDQAILAGIVANVLTAPLVALAFGFALAASILQIVSPEIGEAMATVAALPAASILGVIEWIGGSWLARLRPSAIEALPLNAVRAILITAVITVFGRHARRGIGDARVIAGTLGPEERAIWAAAMAGGALGLVVLLLWR